MSMFRKAFGTEKNKYSIPKEIENVIQSKAPKGCRYQKSTDGFFVLVPESDSEPLKFNVKLPSDFKDMGISTHEEMEEMIYRTQKKMLVEDLRIANHLLTKNDLVKNPYVEIENTQAFVIPRPFPKAVSFPIYFGDHILDFQLKRQPLANFNQMLFESKYIGMFKLSLRVFEEDYSMKLNLSFSFQECKDLNEVISYKEYLKAYLNNELFFNGKEGRVRFDTKISESSVDDTLKILDFYQKLYEVEKITKKEFSLSKDIHLIDVINTEKLYVSLIEKKFFVFEGVSDTLTFSFDIKELRDSLEEFKESQKQFAFTAKINNLYKILDEDLTMTERVFIKKARIVDIIDTESGLDVIVNIADEKCFIKILDKNFEEENVDISALIDEVANAEEIKVDR